MLVIADLHQTTIVLGMRKTQTSNDPMTKFIPLNLSISSSTQLFQLNEGKKVCKNRFVYNSHMYSDLPIAAICPYQNTYSATFKQFHPLIFICCREICSWFNATDSLLSFRGCNHPNLQILYGQTIWI